MYHSLFHNIHPNIKKKKMDNENGNDDVWESLFAEWEHDMAPVIQDSGVDFTDLPQGGLSGNCSPAQDLSLGAMTASAKENQTDESHPHTPPINTETAGQHTTLQDEIERLKLE
jgi:hypothetical protein